MDAGSAITVAVVSYNTQGLLRACLAALTTRQAEDEAELEIVVADNGSTDGSAEMVHTEFPAVRLIKTGGNIGFGRANNLALREARGRFVCLVNSDAEVLPGALAKAQAYLDTHPDAGLAGGQLLWPDGRPQTSWGYDPTLTGVWEEQTFLGAARGWLARKRPNPPAPFPVKEGGVRENREREDGEASSSPHSSPFPNREGSALAPGVGPTGVGPTEAKDVEQISGAFMLIRRTAWEQVGGFDPAYFMYNEDVDLNVRLRRAGWRVVFLPDVFIQHHLGASSRADWQTRARMVAAYNESRFFYFARYEGAQAARRLRTYCLLGAALRLTGWTVVSLVKPAARDKVRLFREVWRRTWAVNT